jgi:DNA-binding transcriptional MocR family regulator
MWISGKTTAEIARSIEDGVHAGRHDAAAPLPTIRELAAGLKVSPATVAAAYRLLRTRGLLTGERRRGTRVRRFGDGHASHPPRAAPASDLVDLATGNPDPRLLPSLNGALRTIPTEPALYNASAELGPLVAFAKGEFAADGIEVRGLIVTAGALDAIERILREHLRPGDRVAIEDPGFPALADLLAASGFLPEPIAVDEEGPVPTAMDATLAGRPAAIILTPRGQNPTGASLTTQRAADLRAILKRHPLPVLIENDPLGPVAGAPAVTLTDGRSRWAIVRSTSKFLGPDLRVALVAGDDLTLARVRGRQALGPRRVSYVLQHLALMLWSDPSSGRHLARAADTYAHRRQSLLRALATRELPVRAPAGMNVWIPVRHETAVVEQLAACGWAVAAGERFRLRSGPGIRVTTSALVPEDAQRFAVDLVAALRTGAPVLA